MGPSKLPQVSCPNVFCGGGSFDSIIVSLMQSDHGMWKIVDLISNWLFLQGLDRL
jgi:hypothetical protein